MSSSVQAPAAKSDEGFLLKRHFQVAYVTNDLARAREVFGKRYGIREFHSGEGRVPNADIYTRTSRAWAGGTMYELIEAEGPDAAFYNDRLSFETFQIRHHHFGYLIKDQGEWNALLAAVADEQLKIAHKMEMPGYMSLAYVEAPELDHYLEFVFPEGPGIDLLQNTPAN